MTEHYTKIWHKQYEKLVEFKRTNGHCMVPSKYDEDRSLSVWVKRQRKHQKDDEIRLDRKEILDEIGFAWKDDGWHKQYEKISEFKRKHGHCVVPYNYERDMSLGKWVARQRNHHKNNKLRIDRKRILDKIGFAWNDDELESKWNQQYEKIIEFKRNKGHCMVPYAYEQDKPLGQWVTTQRVYHKNNKLRLDRKELLDQIGFAWNPRARAVRSSTSTTDVRVLVIRSFHSLERLCYSLSFFFFFLVVCRIQIRKRHPGVWVSHTKH
jgi:hemerythrin superfamily protein